VAEKLATTTGMLVVPGSAFAAGSGDDKYDRWIRIAVANVSEEQLDEVCRRLRLLEEISGWKVEGPT